MGVFRIAVLECDTPIEAVRERYGTYGNIVRRLLEDGLKSLPDAASDVKPVFTSWNVVVGRQYPKPEDVDALVLSGSKYNSFDNDEWILELLDYVRNFHKNTEKPLLGVCFGHQIIARALGGQVQRNSNGWEIAVNQVQLSASGKKLFGRESLSLHQMHRDAVVSVPESLEILGSSPVCGIQGLFVDKRVLTVQSHPEFDEFIMRTLLNARHEMGIFDDEIFEEAFSRAGYQHDGLLVSSVMWKFMLGK